ncbi:MAG: PH domain-containing protein [Micrococcales bacterium]|nr:PH domain-containing protein [Micrococcales bacterium]
MILAPKAAELPDAVRAYLAPGERIVLATHQHRARLLEPVATTLLAFSIWLLLEANLTGATASLGPPLRIVFLIVVLRLIWCFIDWRRDWIVVTNKRLLRRHGVIAKHVPMMPFTKVTDMSYVRTLPGRVFGFGRFVMESAGQDQALRIINWIPDPDETYRIICAEIFDIHPSESDSDDGKFAGFDDFDDGDRDGDRPGGGETAYPDVPGVHNPISERLESYSRPMPISPARSGEPVYESDDLRKRRRGRRTGPMPFHPNS